ncbi:hypothetical protein KRX19_08720 [Cardiobacteriaceae bacterium TAE3-ERU3]|nr:hypothetical protein [Cardiobacteriaceae bacterium TAE3-ERU3]
MQHSAPSPAVKKWPLMAKVFLLGVMSGYPQIFVFSLVTVWLKDTGYSRSAITAFGAIAILYAFNWLLAPLLDRYRGLGLDRRRFWIIAMQSLMLVACLAASRVDVASSLWLLVGATLVLTFASALQDVAIDALRIEITPPGHSELLSMGAGFATAGWWTGFSLGGALGLEIVGYLKDHAIDANAAWQQVYLYLSVFFVLAIILTWLIYRPIHRKVLGVEVTDESVQSAGGWFEQVVIAPFRSLFQSRGAKFALILLAFVFLFKLGEAFLGRSAILFYKDIGFSDQEISRYAKIFGWVSLMILALVSGIIAGQMKSWKALMYGGIAMASTNLLYSVLAIIGPQTWFLAFAVVADNITTAFSTVAFVGFISTVCSDRKFTGTQYALLASTASFSRMLLASSSGFVLDHWLGGSWTIFFVLTAVMAVPSLILLWFMRDQFQQ